MAKGKKLPFPTIKVTWRFREDNIDLLRATHPDVNEIVRVLIDTYCDHLRRQLAGQPIQITLTGIDAEVVVHRYNPQG